MKSDKLKEARAARGMSMQAMADALGISFNTYQKYEYSSREPSYDTLSKMADILGVTTDYLLGREPQPDDPIEMLSRGLNLNLYEKAIVTAYLAMDTKSRTDLVKMVQNVADAIKNGTESKKYTYTIQVAARGGDPPHTEEMTQEERERIANLPRVPDDL